MSMDSSNTQRRTKVATFCGVLAALPFAIAGIGLFFLMRSVNSELKIENPILHTASLWSDTIHPNLLAIAISLIPIGIGVVVGKSVVKKVESSLQKRRRIN
jgi:nucleoside recognition membrane protein YjiH